MREIWMRPVPHGDTTPVVTPSSLQIALGQPPSHAVGDEVGGLARGHRAGGLAFQHARAGRQRQRPRRQYQHLFWIKTARLSASTGFAARRY
ncbi:MAG: hypothetical protein EBZ11_04420 [Alphaproteobacteria bacterium]|nr:hypothetical protein [Alphaproteobacteria bacterium]